MLITSLSFDDILGQIYDIYIIVIAGADSAIGLGMLVAFYGLVFIIVKINVLFFFRAVCWTEKHFFFSLYKKLKIIIYL